MTSKPIPDPEPWVHNRSSTSLATLDGLVGQGRGVYFVDAPTHEHLAIARHLGRRAECAGAPSAWAHAPIDPEPWLELALQCGVQPGDAASTARALDKAAVSVMIVVEPSSDSMSSQWGRSVCTELARLGGETKVFVLTRRPAAIARQLTLGRFGEDDMQRFYGALVEHEGARSTTFDSPAALEAWWHKRKDARADACGDEAGRLLRRLALLGRSAPRALVAELGSDTALQSLVRRAAVVSTQGRVRVIAPPAESSEVVAEVDVLAVADVLLRHERDAWAIMRAAELRQVAGQADWKAALAAVRTAPDAAARADMWFRFETQHQAVAHAGADADASQNPAPSLVEVAGEALECGDSEQALRLAQRALTQIDGTFDLFMVMARALRARGDLTAASVALSRAGKLAGDGEAAPQSVEAAEQRLALGDLEGARAHAEAALDADAPIRLAARNVIGKVLLSEGAWDEAELQFAADEQGAREAARPSDRLRARLNRAIAVMSAGRRSEARSLLQSVLDEGHRLGDRRARAFALANLSTFATDTHDYGAAIELLERAIDDVRALGDQPRLSRLIANLAELRLRVGAVEEAEQALAFARQACGPTPGGPTAALLSYVSAHARLSRGHTLQAAAEIDDAIRAADTSSNGGKLSQCCRLATRIALEDGEIQRAQRYLARSRDAGPYQNSVADIAVLAAMIEQAAGHDFEAAAITALDAAQSAGDVELTREAHVLCHLATRDQEPARADRHLDAALRLRDHLAAALPDRLRAGFLARRDLVALTKLEQLAATPNAVKTLPPPEAPPSAVSLDSAMERLVGEADDMVSLREAITKVGRSDATVLIHGESGTGKELVADAVHAASGRAHGPIVKINCAALVETLLLSELFGHERGAFTGAHTKRRGRFEQADGGTIFLDEIGDISPKTQVALLRVLQERTFERVGGTAQISVDVRVVCATHRDLATMVAEGRFREDLYYRLCGVTLQTPNLRARLGDLEALSTALLERISVDHGDAPKRLSPAALEGLARHAWPGNVRELENALRAASLFAEGRVIQLEDITDNVASLQHLAAASGPPSSPVSHARTRHDHPNDVVYAEVHAGTSLPDMKRALERACIERALADTDGNITKAAKLLGMKRPRLSQLVNQYARDEGNPKGSKAEVAS